AGLVVTITGSEGSDSGGITPSRTALTHMTYVVFGSKSDIRMSTLCLWPSGLSSGSSSGSLAVTGKFVTLSAASSKRSLYSIPSTNFVQPTLIVTPLSYSTLRYLRGSAGGTAPSSPSNQSVNPGSI